MALLRRSLSPDWTGERVVPRLPSPLKLKCPFLDLRNAVQITCRTVRLEPDAQNLVKFRKWRSPDPKLVNLVGECPSQLVVQRRVVVTEPRNHSGRVVWPANLGEGGLGPLLVRI